MEWGAPKEGAPGPRRLAPAEETLLTRQASAGDAWARTRLIELNQGLVVSVAHKFQCASMELEDLIQEGVIGLARAIDLFEPARGLRFSTYAVHWIRQAITRAIDNKARLIRVPVNSGYSALRADRAGQELTATLGRPATLEEIAAETGEPVRRVARLLDGMSETAAPEVPDPAFPRPRRPRWPERNARPCAIWSRRCRSASGG